MSLTRLELKKLRSLAERKGRMREHRFLAEGVRLLEEALRWNVLPESLYHHRSISRRGVKLVRDFSSLKVSIRETNAREMEKITPSEKSQGIAGVFKLPDESLQGMNDSGMTRVLWCHSISDPGNTGTLLRSALAFEFDLVVLTGNSSDPFSPKVVRSSMGAIFALPIARGKAAEVLKLARDEGYFTLVSDVSGADDIHSISSTEAAGKLILAVGSEATGLPKEIIDTADKVLRIKHAETVGSLNAAVAGSILMREIYERH